MNKTIAGWIAGILVMSSMGAGGAEPPPAPRGELHIVDKRDSNRWSIEEASIELLVELDVHGNIVPNLAQSWYWRDEHTLVLSLRQGVTFHNGEVFDAEILKLNWEAWEKFRDFLASEISSGHWRGQTFAPGTRLEILDSYTVQIVLPEPDVETFVKLRTSMSIANRQFFHFLEQRRQETGRRFGGLLQETLRMPGPWGTGPYLLHTGEAQITSKTAQVVLEANPAYWNRNRFPKVRRIVFENALNVSEAVEHLKTSEGHVDVILDLPPLETLRVAQSAFGAIVKERSSLTNMRGMFNMRKASSLWHDVRLRQAANYAVNRAHLLRYAAKGNGVLTPSFLAPPMFGYDPTLPLPPCEPETARRLLQEAGYAQGLDITMIAPQHMHIQATVVSKMLEDVGFKVNLQMIEQSDWFANVYTVWVIGPVGRSQQRSWPTWDIALVPGIERTLMASTYLPTLTYMTYTLEDSWLDWVDEQPALRQLHAQLLKTTDREQQQEFIRQIEQHIQEQAYFLLLYSPLQVHAVNKEVQFIPRPDGILDLRGFEVTDQHWSVRR